MTVDFYNGFILLRYHRPAIFPTGKVGPSPFSSPSPAGRLGELKISHFQGISLATITIMTILARPACNLKFPESLPAFMDPGFI
jgi:hypothetical protein